VVSQITHTRKPITGRVCMDSGLRVVGQQGSISLPGRRRRSASSGCQPKWRSVSGPGLWLASCGVAGRHSHRVGRSAGSGDPPSRDADHVDGDGVIPGLGGGGVRGHRGASGESGARALLHFLMSVVDDQGRWDNDVRLLRAHAYPLRTDSVELSEMAAWLKECVAARLIRLYEVAGKRYLEVLDFKQRLRLRRAKYPCPGCGKLHVTDICPSHDRHMTVMCPPEAETETETKTETGVRNPVREYLEVYPKKTKQDPASRAYVSQIAGVTGEHAKLMAGLERHLVCDQWVRSLQKDGGRYVPDPDTFIVERRYLDQPPPYRGDKDEDQTLALMREMGGER